MISHGRRIVLVVALLSMCAGCRGKRMDAVADAQVAEVTKNDAASDGARAVIALHAGAIELDGRSLGPATPKLGNPFLLPALDAALPKVPATASGSAVIRVPRESAYRELVPIMFTAGHAGYSRFDLLLDGEESAPAAAPTGADPEPLFVLPSADGCRTTVIEPNLVVVLAHDDATHWMIARASFAERTVRTGKCGPAAAASGTRLVASPPPRGERPVDCARAFATDSAARDACIAGHDAGKSDARVVLGGPDGCLGRVLPRGEAVTPWADAVRDAFALFRLSSAFTNLTADPEETNGAVIAVARAIQERGGLSFNLPKAGDGALGTSKCEGAVRTREELRLAAARWLGAPPP